MRTMTFITGIAAGIAVSAAALSSMYPDVPRRMARDTKRVMRTGRRMVNGIIR